MNGHCAYISLCCWDHHQVVGSGQHLFLYDTYSLSVKGAWLSMTLLEATAYADSTSTLAVARGWDMTSVTRSCKSDRETESMWMKGFKTMRRRAQLTCSICTCRVGWLWDTVAGPWALTITGTWKRLLERAAAALATLKASARESQDFLLKIEFTSWMTWSCRENIS